MPGGRPKRIRGDAWGGYAPDSPSRDPGWAYPRGTPVGGTPAAGDTRPGGGGGSPRRFPSLLGGRAAGDGSRHSMAFPYNPGAPTAGGPPGGGLLEEPHAPQPWDPRARVITQVVFPGAPSSHRGTAGPHDEVIIS